MWTSLFFAASDGWLEAARVLLQANVSPLLSAYDSLPLDMTVLLRTNANPLLSAYDSLSLDMAVWSGNLEIVRELVQRSGIDCCVCDGGALVLAAAAFHNHVDIVAILCDAGVV